VKKKFPILGTTTHTSNPKAMSTREKGEGLGYIFTILRTVRE
jgi:hypothetical protein